MKTMNTKELIKAAKESGQPIPKISDIKDFNKKAKVVGGPVQYSEEEAKKIRNTKNWEKIQRQHKYRHGVLSVEVESSELKWLESLMMKNNEILSDNTIIDYQGCDQPIYLLKKKLMLGVHNYKSLLRTLNNLKDAILRDGLTEKQIQEVLTDENYITEFTEEIVPED